MLAKQHYDLVVAGGGINGTGIARDAAGRGLSVLLCESHDLGAHTSSASTKLIHGGLRYLEHYEFRLVRESLKERERLLAIAPHVIWPLRFVLPHSHEMRSAWMIRAGLFLYDHLGGRKRLPGSEAIRLDRHPVGEPLGAGFTRGFVYSDCWVQDARLVVLNAMDARERGADIRPRTRCSAAVGAGDRWQITLDQGGATRVVEARALVNASGPWAASFIDTVVDRPSANGVRLVKGSHIVVPSLFAHDDAYILQQSDGRIVFAIPYEGRYTLIGTTDVECEDLADSAEISDAEIDYLCAAVNRYFRRRIDRGDVVWSYSGVRPLYDDRSADASAATRDYVLDLDVTPEQPPLLSVFGGKLTTYRRLAEQALGELQPQLGFEAPAWTAGAPLPGGDIAAADFERFVAAQQRARPWLPDPLCRRLARNYGTRIAKILGDARSLDDLGACLGADLTEAELDYLIAEEWAASADDILWRRSKLGLCFDAEARARLDAALAARRTDAPGSTYAPAARAGGVS